MGLRCPPLSAFSAVEGLSQLPVGEEVRRELSDDPAVPRQPRLREVKGLVRGPTARQRYGQDKTSQGQSPQVRALSAPALRQPGVMQTSGTLSHAMAKSAVIAIIQPRFGQNFHLAALSWQERLCKELRAWAKIWWFLATPPQNHFQFPHQFLTACPVPLSGGLPLSPKALPTGFYSPLQPTVSSTSPSPSSCSPWPWP